jgi:large subunit ribosomal protein L4
MALTVEVRRQDGTVSRSIELDPTWFAIQPNVPVMHQVVTAQLAAARAGTQNTKTRAEVRGGGKKPFRQKGTGRARQGSTRAPHWVGGGVALGPKPRSYAQKTPKKMIALALRSALSDRAALGKVAVIDRWEMETPKTKAAIAALEALELVDTRVLIVMDYEDEAAYKSFRNLPGIQLIFVNELNAYDVLVNDTILFSERTLPGTTTGATVEPAPATKASVTVEAEATAEAGATEEAEATAEAGANATEEADVDAAEEADLDATEEEEA